ncbi:MAG: hypothetical protein L7G92_05495 [Stygiolobus sp.]|nr:hypothetical protein [Stygiolobus sp.]
MKLDVSNLDREPRAEIVKKYEDPPLHIAALYRPHLDREFLPKKFTKRDIEILMLFLKRLNEIIRL